LVAIIQDARSLLTDPAFLVSRARLVGYGLEGRYAVGFPINRSSSAFRAYH